MFWKKEKTKEERVLSVIKLIVWFLPIILAVLILDKRFVPMGNYAVKYQVEKGSPLVKNFASKEPDRLIGTENVPGSTDYFQQITVSPMYFDVKVPRPFAKATVTVQYQNPQNQSVIQLGVQQANGAYAYTTLANSNPILDSLPDYWEVLQDGDTYLWQRNTEYQQKIKDQLVVFEARKKQLNAWKEAELVRAVTADEQATVEERYQDELNTIIEESVPPHTGRVRFSSVQDFLANIPARDEIVQYHYDLSKYFELSGYQPSDRATEITRSIRGKHEIYTYLGDGENLNFIFTTQDINRHVGEDPVTITVFGPAGKVIEESSLVDDGETGATGRVFAERQMQVEIKDLPHGVYRLAVDMNDDVFIKKIVTLQHLIEFKGSIYLTDNREYQSILDSNYFKPTAIYTNSSRINARTSHVGSLQTLQVGSSDLLLDNVNTEKEIRDLTGTTMIVSPENDVYIEGNGFFAFSKDELFDPDVSVVSSVDSVSNVDDYNYIIATYPQAQEDGNWLVASANLDASQLYFDRGGDLLVHFILNMPGLHENNLTLKIKEINIEFTKKPLTVASFFTKVSNWLKENISRK